MPTELISTWIYLDSPKESSEYPQVGKNSHSGDFQKVYWKCVAVFFALSTRFNASRKHVLFSNKSLEDFPKIDGFDLAGFLKRRNVEVVTLPLTWQTPEGFFGRWRNQFYIFDILEFFEKHYTNHSDTFIVLDSDCLVNRSLDELFNRLQTDGLMVLPMPYTAEANINGVSRQEMRTIFGELDGGSYPDHDPVYYGGEIFAADLLTVKRINALAPAIWQAMLERHDKGLKKLNEEAHFLSYCYYKIGSFGNLEPFIKRIWTSPQHSTMIPADLQLPVWHLPSEKTGGIALLFECLKKNEHVLTAPDAEMPVELGTYVGIPKRTKWLDARQLFRYTRLYRWLKKLQYASF